MNIVPSFRRSALLACALGLLLGTLWQAPARWLAMATAAASQDHVQLLNARGTLWNGQADLLLTGGPGSLDRQALPGPVRWRVRPVWVGGGPALQVVLDARCCLSDPLTLVLGYREGAAVLTLTDHQSVWSAGLLSGLGTPWNTVQLQGQLVLNTTDLAVRWQGRALALQGEVTLDLQDAASALSTFRPLGDYRVRLVSPQPGLMTMELRTLQGDLAMTGDGHWSAGRFRFRGTAEAHPDHVNALSNLLNVLGQRDGLRAYLSWG